jgi:hypothetical protein
MNVLIELTPTPTPPPKATPKPFTLEEFIYPWKITALTSGSVEIHDAKEAKTFTMRLEGEGQVVLLQQQTMTVTLCGIDVNDLSATFCGDGQRHTIKY